MKDCTYEEIQERLQLPDSENATNTIYATVSSPNPVPSTHYATINFQNSEKAAAETVRLGYSACEYSTVKFPKCRTDSSDTQLYPPTEEPLYSTVNKLRKWDHLFKEYNRFMNENNVFSVWVTVILWWCFGADLFWDLIFYFPVKMIIKAYQEDTDLPLSQEEKPTKRSSAFVPHCGTIHNIHT